MNLQELVERGSDDGAAAGGHDRGHIKPQMETLREQSHRVIAGYDIVVLLVWLLARFRHFH